MADNRSLIQYVVENPTCTEPTWHGPHVTASNGARFPWVAGVCPMGCGETLFLGAGGHVTCSYIPCPNPCAADELLHAEADRG